MFETIGLALGGNVGEVEKNLALALKALETHLGPILACSQAYVTEPWGPIPQGDFINQALLLQTQDSPMQVLKKILEIEQSLGRERKDRFGPRTMDIDLIFYGQKVMNEDLLILPHPRMQARRFVLQPMVEIAPNWMHPILHKTMKELLDQCPDEGKIAPLSRRKQ